MNEIIGWLATGMTMLSYLFHKMIFLRIVNFVACVIWVIYGILTTTNPVIATNAIIGCIHLYWFYKNRDKIKNNVQF